MAWRSTVRTERESTALALTASTPAGTSHARDVQRVLEPLVFELPPPEAHGGEDWQRVIDTALPSPDDISLPREAVAVPGRTYAAAPRSVVLLCVERGSRL